MKTADNDNISIHKTDMTLVYIEGYTMTPGQGRESYGRVVHLYWKVRVKQKLIMSSKSVRV